MTLYYKMRQTLLQNATAILLQNAAKVYQKMLQIFSLKVQHFITKCSSYYKMRLCYYKKRQLLKNALFITKCFGTQIVGKFPNMPMHLPYS